MKRPGRRSVRSRVRRAVGSLVPGLRARSGPLRWDRPPPAGAPPAESEVDVVVPVYGAHDELQECLESVARHTDLERHRLVLVVDADPKWHDGLLATVHASQPEAQVETLVNERQRGFVSSVNRGMAHGARQGRDALILNSDTIVSAGWLEKMAQAAASRPDVATVTPFSNHATLCSLPEPWTANPLPSGHDVDSFARLVERAAMGERPRLPTGVGFCLLVRRAALKAIGPFDEEAFGAGYGEETEFCLRALEKGFVHLLDDATFVFHHGERSFGPSRERRVRRAERVLRSRHPAYVATLARFMEVDPLRPARRRVRWALRRAAGAARSSPASPARVLHLVHGWPPHNHAGTEVYARNLARCQSEHRAVAVYTRIADPERGFGEASETIADGIRVRLIVNNFTQRSPLSRNALRSRRLESDFGRFLEEVKPDLVHAHHLAGHTLTLPSLVGRHGLPLVYQVQDWWAYCARANLAHREGGLCPGPSPWRCSACLPLTRLPGHPLLNPLLYTYRRRLAHRQLGLADAFVMGSRAIEKDYRDAGFLQPDDEVFVLTYGVETPRVEKARPRAAGSGGSLGEVLRFAYVGSILPHKGVHLAVEAFRDIDPSQATMEVWGDLESDPDYTRRLRNLASPGVSLRGRFEDEERDRLFASMDVLLLPSIGLESFGLVAREAMAAGAVVIASRHSALKELFVQDGAGGTWVEPGDPDDLRRLVASLVRDPGQIEDWRLRRPKIVNVAEHAEEIEQVYLDVLEARVRGSAS